MEAAPHPWPALGVLLMRDGLVTKDDLEAVLREQSDSRQQRVSGRRLGELLVAKGALTQKQVAKLVAEQYELPFVEIDTADIDLRVAHLLTPETARRFSALPIRDWPDGSILVAVADPASVLFSEELRHLLGAPPRFAVVAQEAIDAAIDHVYNRSRQETEAPDAGVEQEEAPHVHPVAPLSDQPDLDPREPAPRWSLLGAMLLRDGLVTDAELEAALAQQRLSGGRRVGEILVDRGVVNRTEVARLVAEQYELPFVELGDYHADPMTAALLPEEIAMRYSAVPTGLLPDGSLRVVVADPTKVLYADEFHAALGVPLNLAVAAPDVVEAAIVDLYGQADADTGPILSEPAEPVAATREEAAVAEDEPPATEEDVDAERVQAAVSELAPDTVPAELAVDGELDLLIERALSLGASAIHFSPQPGGLVVRARIDGVMRELATLGESQPSALTGRLKAIGTPTSSDRIVDLRADSISTKRGDKVTLRVHGGVAAPSSFTELGMASDNARTALKAIHQPFGAIVVCGPTGSGRTTTLYAALHELNTPERTLTTVEDPIEHLTTGIDQVEVDEVAGVSFAHGLSAILQTDSDVVLVGEIRDADTARIAARAAMTDSLVLAGLQAPTAAGAIRRLAELGVEPGLLAATVTCVVAQRLVRRICRDCRETHYAAEADLVELGRPTNGEGPRLLARGRGCPSCGGTGFNGRVGLFEVLPLTGEVATLVAEAAPPAAIQRAAVAAGMRTLRDEGVRLCLEGLTTPAEVRRVAGDWAQ